MLDPGRLPCLYPCNKYWRTIVLMDIRGGNDIGWVGGRWARTAYWIRLIVLG